MGGHLIWLTAWVSLVATVFECTRWNWMTIPWVPVSLMGTAVAFYVGFKNNQAYDRLWEGRKIWGAIVNSSRAWGSMVRAYINDHFATEKHDPEALKAIHQRLIYRHIAWLYALRSQLLQPMRWEHASLNNFVGTVNRKRMQKTGIGTLDPDLTEKMLKAHLSDADYRKFIQTRNPATHMLDRQAQELSQLNETGLLNDFRHIDLQKQLVDLYAHQGMAERIKRFPLPRQYASASFIFVVIFILLLPLGMVNEFSKLGPWGVWVSIPFCVVIGWVYVFMEIVGDYSENPFEGLSNDVPMYSLCRTIEIDLKEMLGETDLPEGVEARGGVLM